MSADESGGPDAVVVRKAEHGWVVGGENVSDLTTAMVLADLFAADLTTGDLATSDGTRRRAAGAQTPPRSTTLPFGITEKKLMRWRGWQSP
jgi:hypothetical protein